MFAYDVRIVTLLFAVIPYHHCLGWFKETSMEDLEAITVSEQSFEISNSTLFKGHERFTIFNARYPVNITHIIIPDAHNRVFVYWGKNNSKEIYIQTKDMFEDYQSRSFFYKIRKNGLDQWRIKNVTSTISSKKVQKVVNRDSGRRKENSSTSEEKYRMKILPNRSARLIVSENKEGHNIKIFKAGYSKRRPFKDFIFVDSAENMIAFCGLYNETRAAFVKTDYYESALKNFYSFSATLDNVLCIDPDRNFPDTWLSSSLKEPLTDILRLTDSRGVIIASQFHRPLSLEEARMLHVSHLRSAISFDHGTNWRTLKLHNDCRHTMDDSNLYIDQAFSRLQFDQNHLGVLEELDTAGVIVATGHLAYSDSPNELYPGVFVSQDGGLNWKKVFHDRLIVSVIHPNWQVLMAVQHCLKSSTKRIYLSNDLGSTWIFHDIFEEEVCVHDVVTGGEANNSLFIIISTIPGREDWIATVIDFESLAVITKPCREDFIDLWPPKSSEYFCINGEKFLTYRRNSKKLCSLSTDKSRRSIISHNCSCTSDDFVCREDKFCPPMTPTSLLRLAMKYQPSNVTTSSSPNTRNTSVDSDIYRKLPFVLGFRKKLRNACIVTHSLYEKPSLEACKDSLEKRFYFSGTPDAKLFSQLLAWYIFSLHCVFFLRIE